MRILIHDYAGHPFEVQLSRELAARGHQVMHLYCESTHTPRGSLLRKSSDPQTFDIHGVGLSETIPKTSFYRRFKLESQYGHRLIAVYEQFRPEVVLSANTPSIPEMRLAYWCARNGVRLISWIQDIYGLAAYRLLRRKLPILGGAVGRYFIHLDKRCARLSDGIVVISEDFCDVLKGWGIDARRIHVIHNWAPLEDLPQRPRENNWSREHQLTDGLHFVYSGTLALKHNPALLLELARTLDQSGPAELLVVSEGAGVEWLSQKAAEQHIRSLRCFGFQSFEALPDVLGSADVLLAILEPDAGVFSVPSKVLSYLCAGRPLLLAVPGENLVAQIVTKIGAGPVVEPTDIAGFCASARNLIESPELRDQCGKAARAYAESHFDIQRIGDQFEAILAGTV
ncbi:MAG TPA: glycosyltransferase family 4 protein [Lacipirellulaceae bacterium]|nr:glycosyltransferase family 4 protein [Lacipirellulaceae bacterium]